MLVPIEKVPVRIKEGLKIAKKYEKAGEREEAEMLYSTIDSLKRSYEYIKKSLGFES